MTRRLPSLVMLLALVGGWAAASVHGVHHAAEWDASRAAHLAESAHADGEDGHHHASAPCALGDAAGLDCAVCGGLSSARLAGTPSATPLGDERYRAAERTGASGRWIASGLARGPPTA